jgi:hypothetical protein
MNLQEFKNYIEQSESGKVFEYSVSEPFSWRGSYDEVAFEILQSPMSREDILKNIEIAYNETFYGYKGGEFRYSGCTPVNFEQDYSRWTDGGYRDRLIARIEGNDYFKSEELRLVNLAFPISLQIDK